MRTSPILSTLATSFAGVLSLLLSVAAPAQPSFTVLPALPGSESENCVVRETHAISGDGGTVLGSCSGSGFRWTAASGTVPIDISTSPFLRGHGASFDGSVIVGHGPLGSTVTTAFRWFLSAGSAFALPDFGANAEVRDVSGDGVVVVGWNGSQAVSWTAAGGLVGLGFIPECVESVAHAASYDGSVIVGSGLNCGSAFGDHSIALRWSQTDGMQSLGVLQPPEATGHGRSSAAAVSADGSAIVGVSSAESGFSNGRAFLWTNADGMINLGLAPGDGSSINYVAHDVAQEGCTVVGNTTSTGGAFIWDPVHGMRHLATVLTGDFGLDLSSIWTLGSLAAEGISDDGTVITGHANAVVGALVRQRPYVAVIENPICNPVCGDDLVTGDEECDDGNAQSGDGCRDDCTLEICGDGILDPQEGCDDGNTSAGDGCQPNCALPFCGDGWLDPGDGEECDDGNNDPADGCSATCGIEVCGNGILDPLEECDDGNGVLGDGCRPDCTQELCGDLVLDPQEQCDDGNNSAGDGCRGDCTEEVCGDGTLDPQEQCDDGNNSPGDGCRADCSEESCGDGVLDPQEGCDDGNTSAGDGCSATCGVEVCGNGILDPVEECDDGNLSSGDGCRDDCTIEACGDGVLDPQEQCDDGNLVDGDGCSAACEIEVSGGGQGCTPGYWKQEHHFDSWPAAYLPGTIAEGGTPFGAVFENAFPNQSISQVLAQGGGGLKALGRHTAAALLNAASSGVSYDLTTLDVIEMFDQTHPGSKPAYNTLKANFESFNEQGCPLH